MNFDVKAQLRDLVSDSLEAFGLHAQASLDSVADYAAERADHLASIVGEVGFMLAVEAEARNVALKAAVRASEFADEGDDRFTRVLQGGLRIAAGLLATV